jgi:hypothetical protein
LARGVIKLRLHALKEEGQLCSSFFLSHDYLKLGLPLAQRRPPPHILHVAAKTAAKG